MPIVNRAGTPVRNENNGTLKARVTMRVALRRTAQQTGQWPGRDPVQQPRFEVLSAAETTTTTRLIEALAGRTDGPLAYEVAWGEFDARVRPMLIVLAERSGLSGADAEDAAQESLSQFARDLRAGRYARERGRLRGWLVGIMRNRIIDALRARPKGGCGSGGLSQAADKARLSAIWDAEFKRVVLERSIRLLFESGTFRAQTLDLFRRHVLEGVPGSTVAAEAGVRPEAVYVAKHRCLSKLRRLMAEVSATFDDV